MTATPLLADRLQRVLCEGEAVGLANGHRARDGIRAVVDAGLLRSAHRRQRRADLQASMGGDGWLIGVDQARDDGRRRQAIGEAGIGWRRVWVGVAGREPQGIDAVDVRARVWALCENPRYLMLVDIIP